MDAQTGANRAHWKDRTRIHLASGYYGVGGVVRDGPQPIFGSDEEEVGDVRGKRLLHLHCHIGTDSLRWAALGADVTGVDISDASIDAADRLAATLGLRARFIRADVHDLPDLLDETFDVVYSSYGVLCWVPDVGRWVTVAARFVRPGGFFYLAEGHPFDVAVNPGHYQRTGYFDTGPRRYEDTSTYSDWPPAITHATNYRWHHTLGDVVTAVAAAGLRIGFLHENPWCPRQRDPHMTIDDLGRWHTPGDPTPLAYSIKATRELLARS